MISVLIPFHPSNKVRSEIFQWNWKRLENLLSPYDHEIVAASSETSLYSPTFNRSKAINEAYRRSKGDVLIIIDSDTVFDEDVLQDALTVSGWRLPYSHYLLLTRQFTRTVMAEGPHTLLSARPAVCSATLTADPKHPHNPPCSGVLAFTREAFEASGGYDESYEGWGYEDNAFALNCLKQLGPPDRGEGTVYHLWHPRSKGQKLGSEEAEANRRRYELYCRNYEWKNWLK